MKRPTKAQILATFGPTDLDEFTTQQAIRQYHQVEEQLNVRNFYNLDTEDQEWRLARLKAKIDRDMEGCM